MLAEYQEFFRPLFFTNPLVCALLTLFVFFTVFGVLNVLMGVIVEQMQQATQDLKMEEDLFDEESKLNALFTLRRMFQNIDADRSDTVSEAELTEAMGSTQMQQ